MSSHFELNPSAQLWINRPNYVPIKDECRVVGTVDQWNVVTNRVRKQGGYWLMPAKRFTYVARMYIWIAANYLFVDHVMVRQEHRGNRLMSRFMNQVFTTDYPFRPLHIECPLNHVPIYQSIGFKPMTETMLTRLKEKVSDERDLWTVP